MRNLKRFLAVLVAIAIIATTMVTAFAADTVSADAKLCADLGVLKGTTGTVDSAYLAKSTTRMQAAVLTLRLLGKEQAALAWTGTANFKDANKLTWLDGRKVMAYLKANPGLGWVGNKDNFDPNAKITAPQLYKVLLEALGYRQGVDFQWADVLAFAESKGLKAIKDVTNVTNNDVATALVEALKATVVTGNMTLVEKLVANGIVKESAAINLLGFKVVSATAINATQVVVKFNKAVSDAATGKGALNTANYSIQGSTVTSAAISADKLSVTLTVAAAMSGTKLITVQPIALAADATKATEIFTYVQNYSDTVAPAVSGVAYSVWNKAEVSFTEPLGGIGTVTAYQDGALISISYSLNAAGTVATFDLTPSTIAVDKAITVVFVGTVDKANNLISPNPTTVTLVKTQSDKTAPAVAEAKVLSNKTVKVVFSEKLSGYPVVTAGSATTPSAVTLSTDDYITFTGILTTPFTGVGKINVTAGYADVSGNAGAAYASGFQQFVADTTAPVLQSTEVKVINNVPYLVFKYDEAVTPTAIAVAVTGSKVKDYVSTSVSTTFTAVAYNDGTNTDAKAVMVSLNALAEGAYTVNVGASLVADLSANASAAASISFARGAVSAAADTTAPTNTALYFSADNAYAYVQYSESMDPSTALNVNNYKVGGASIFSSAIFEGNDTFVKLTVIPGTIAYTGVYSVTIADAKDKNNNAMTAYSANISVEENIKPYVVSAALKDVNTITVTFSENVDVAASAFEVYVDGVKAASAINSSVSGVKTVDVTIATVSDLSKNYQIKLLDAKASDMLGNKATAGVMITVAK